MIREAGRLRGRAGMEVWIFRTNAKAACERTLVTVFSHDEIASILLLFLLNCFIAPPKKKKSNFFPLLSWRRREEEARKEGSEE